jgi:hypothetical protein
MKRKAHNLTLFPSTIVLLMGNRIYVIRITILKILYRYGIVKMDKTNEQPRRKQRGIQRNLRPKGRGIRPTIIPLGFASGIMTLAKSEQSDARSVSGIILGA